MKSGIYGWKNTLNGKWYIGQSVDVARRQREHMYALRHGTHSCAHWQSAYNKYGESAFEFHLLESVIESCLDAREIAWIAQYQSNNPQFGYNSDIGGKGRGRMSPEARAKISEKMKGANNPNYGKPMSEGTKAKLALANAHMRPPPFTHHTEAAKAKMAASWRVRHQKG